MNLIILIFLIYFQIENESFQMLVNQWDIGEGRLRPRRTSKLNNEPISKVKCDHCGKFFRAAYIKVCITNEKMLIDKKK
jgi:hypothetical protein